MPSGNTKFLVAGLAKILKWFAAKRILRAAVKGKVFGKKLVPKVALAGCHAFVLTEADCMVSKSCKYCCCYDILWQTLDANRANTVKRRSPLYHAQFPKNGVPSQGPASYFHPGHEDSHGGNPIFLERTPPSAKCRSLSTSCYSLATLTY